MPGIFDKLKQKVKDKAIDTAKSVVTRVMPRHDSDNDTTVTPHDPSRLTTQPPEALNDYGEVAYGPGDAVEVWGQNQDVNMTTFETTSNAGAYAIAGPRHKPLPVGGEGSVLVPNGTRGEVRAIGPVTVMVKFPEPWGLLHMSKKDIWNVTGVNERNTRWGQVTTTRVDNPDSSKLRPNPSPAMPRLSLLGQVGDLTFYLVDGDWIRDNATSKKDLDFTMGGTHARYPEFIPDGEGWIDNGIANSPEDVAATIVHEFREYHRMKDHGEDYSEAHDATDTEEEEFRAEDAGMEENADPVDAARVFLGLARPAESNDGMAVAAPTRVTAASIIDLKGLGGLITGEIADVVYSELSAHYARFGNSAAQWGDFDIQRIAETAAARLAKVTTVGAYIAQLKGTAPVLSKPQAEELFSRVTIVRDSPGRINHSRRGDFIPGMEEINIYLAPILAETIDRGLRYALSRANLQHEILQTVEHELRHAADWAYQEAGAPGRFFDEIAGDIDKIPGDKYYNIPTEIRSFAGNAAREIWRVYGKRWRNMDGAKLVEIASEKDPRMSLMRIDESNRRKFLQMMIRSLEQLETESTRNAIDPGKTSALTTRIGVERPRVDSGEVRSEESRSAGLEVEGRVNRVSHGYASALRVTRVGQVGPVESEYGQTNTAIMPKVGPDQLVRRIKTVLTPELLKPKHIEKIQMGAHPLTGHAYASVESLYHLLGGATSGYEPTNIRHEGESHWYLRGPDGTIHDPTSEQFASPVPYDKGRGRGFLTSEPSARARKIMERVTRKWGMLDKISLIHRRAQLDPKILQQLESEWGRPQSIENEIAEVSRLIDRYKREGVARQWIEELVRIRWKLQEQAKQRDGGMTATRVRANGEVSTRVAALDEPDTMTHVAFGKPQAWIDPSGQWHPLSGPVHREWAMQHLVGRGKGQPIDETTMSRGPGAPLRQLFDEGWIRVSHGTALEAGRAADKSVVLKTIQVMAAENVAQKPIVVQIGGPENYAVLPMVDIGKIDPVKMTEFRRTVLGCALDNLTNNLTDNPANNLITTRANTESNSNQRGAATITTVNEVNNVKPLRMNEIKDGDRVRFSDGAIGEVTRVFADAPLIEVSRVVLPNGTGETKVKKTRVHPLEVDLIVDSRDPRVETQG